MKRLRPVSVTIVGAWLIMVGLLVQREYFATSSVWQPASYRADTTAVEEWSEVFLQGAKIGYGWTRRSSQGDTLRRIQSHQIFRLTQLGQPQVINMRTEATLNIDWSLRAFSFAMTTAMTTGEAGTGVIAPQPAGRGRGTALEIEGGVDGSLIRMRIRQGGESEGREQTIPVDGPIYLDVGPEMLLAETGLEVGRTVTVPSFDPTTMRTERTVIRVAARDTIELHHQRLPAWRLETEFMGLVLRSWVDSEGNTLRSVAPLGLTIDSATREQALDEGWDTEATLDLVNLASIPAGVMRIEGARGIDSMTVRLRGVELGELDLTFGRQELIEEIVEVKKENLDALVDYELPNGDRALHRYLQPSTFVQSDDRRLRQQAGAIRRRETSARAFAQRLTHWVYQNVEKAPSAGIPDALAVLESRSGDCNEHTTLFTALARASGLPTVMNVGVVYVDGRFYYHAWPSIWLGGWVAVDPTFDQFPADATHLSLVRGDLDRQVELMKVIGRLSIDVVSYHPLPGPKER
jgi:hypothetical protein